MPLIPPNAMMQLLTSTSRQCTKLASACHTLDRSDRRPSRFAARHVFSVGRAALTGVVRLFDPTMHLFRLLNSFTKSSLGTSLIAVGDRVDSRQTSNESRSKVNDQTLDWTYPSTDFAITCSNRRIRLRNSRRRGA